MTKYRKRPVIVEAQLYTVENFNLLRLFVGDTVALHRLGDGALGIETLEGQMMKITPGDWVIRGIKGELYPCKPDIFRATYEPVEVPDPTISAPAYTRVTEGYDPDDAN